VIPLAYSINEMSQMRQSARRRRVTLEVDPNARSLCATTIQYLEHGLGQDPEIQP
jgi:hypothetical protein